MTPEDVARLSPLGHEHINVLGRYSFALADRIAHGELRPLHHPDDHDDLTIGSWRGECSRWLTFPEMSTDRFCTISMKQSVIGIAPIEERSVASPTGATYECSSQGDP